MTWVKTDTSQKREKSDGVGGLHKGHKPGEGGLGWYKSLMITCCYLSYKMSFPRGTSLLKSMFGSHFFLLWLRGGVRFLKTLPGSFITVQSSFLLYIHATGFFPTSFIWKDSPEATRPTWRRSSAALHYCSCVQMMRLRPLAHRPRQAFQSS